MQGQLGELSQALQGCAVNGRTIGAFDCAVWGRLESVISGPTSNEQAAVVVHFYDSVRREVGTQVVTRWRGTSNWQQSRRRIPVPPNTREIIIRIVLNGATGTLDIDDLQLVAVPR